MTPPWRPGLSAPDCWAPGVFVAPELDRDCVAAEAGVVMLLIIEPPLDTSPPSSGLAVCAPVLSAGAAAEAAATGVPDMDGVGGGGVSSVIGVVCVSRSDRTRPTTLRAWPKWSIAELTTVISPGGVVSAGPSAV